LILDLYPGFLRADTSNQWARAWDNGGVWGGTDYSYQNHKDLVIRPFQERGNDWGLFGGLFGFSSQRGCLWLKVRHCGHIAHGKAIRETEGCLNDVAHQITQLQTGHRDWSQTDIIGRY